MAATRTKSVRIKTAPPPEVQRQQEMFSRNLAHQMQLKSLSQSDLAGKVWGKTKDGRGYTVARNRDRISAYLANAGMPGPENLRKLAVVLGCSVEDLVGSENLPRPVTRRALTHVTVALAMVAEHPGMMQVKLDLLLPTEAAMEIVGIAEKYRREAADASAGTDGDGAGGHDQ